MVISADLEGECSDGVITLQITGHAHAFATIVTCPETEPQSVSLEGMFSAPETDRFFFPVACSYIHELEADTAMAAFYSSWEIQLCRGAWALDLEL